MAMLRRAATGLLLSGAGGSRALSAAAGKQLTCTLFPGDGIGPEIAASVKAVFKVPGPRFAPLCSQRDGGGRRDGRGAVSSAGPRSRRGLARPGGAGGRKRPFR